MSKVSPLDYVFAIGKIRALEKFLIKSEVFEEALESNLAQGLQLFVESDLYSADLLHIKDSQDLENILNQELFKLKKLIRELLLNKELACFIEIGNLDNLCLVCKDIGSQFLSDYLGYLIDMHNIKSFLRLYILAEPQEKLNAVLTHQGFIKKEDFIRLYSQDLTAFLNKLEYIHKDFYVLDYTYHLGEAIRKTAQEKSFIYLEKATNDFLIQILKPAKYITFGPEPVLAYYFAKVNEINLIRMIILAKMHNLGGDLVKERLNLVYA